MSGFAYKDGVLTVDGIDLTAIAAEWGTPTYIYSAAAIEERYRHFRDNVVPPSGKVHFAIVKFQPCCAAAAGPAWCWCGYCLPW